MKRGWAKKDIEEVISAIQSTMPDIDITLFRSPSVEKTYGKINDAFHPKQKDESILAVFKSGKETLLSDDINLRFLYPIVTKKECLTCHQNSKVGDTNGVLEIILPIDKLKAPIEFTISSIVYLFLIASVLLGIFIYISIRYFLVFPITDLNDHIETVTHNNNMTIRVPLLRSACLEIKSLSDTFNSLLSRLEKAYTDLRERSEKDPLTGLFNRRKFDEEVFRELQRSKRHQHEFSLFLIDLNYFKPINDTYGHDAGDEMLCRISNALLNSLRDEDILARIGGDEFLILAPEINKDNAEVMASRISKTIASTSIERKEIQLSVDCSIGIASYPEDGETTEKLFKIADIRMYDAKKQGR